MRWRGSVWWKGEMESDYCLSRAVGNGFLVEWPDLWEWTAGQGVREP
jgi:hypothetical protein